MSGKVVLVTGGSCGITVNAITRGGVEIEMTTHILAERGASISVTTPVARIDQPDDIAGIALFLRHRRQNGSPAEQLSPTGA